MNFPTSTQRKSWIFTEEQLAELRQKNRAKSLEVIKRVRAEASVANGEEAATAEGPKKKPKAVSVADELKLLRFYGGKLQEICATFRFPIKVASAGITFLKRFYLSFSVLDYDPKDIFLTAIYLACKVEESYIGAEQFCREVKQDEQTVLQKEPIVLQGLNFDLITYGPYRSLEGFLLDMEEALEQPGALDESFRKVLEGGGLTKLRGSARAAADALMLTDAPLLFPPAQLALAALRSAIRKAGASFSSYLRRVAEKEGAMGSSSSAPLIEEILKAGLARLDELGMQGAQPVNGDEVKKIDRRLKLCHNPLTDPSSDIYKRMAAERDRQARQNHLFKVEERKARTEKEVRQLMGHATPEVLAGAAADGDDSQEPPSKRARMELHTA
eukprot:jgi/Botrbrau1/14503/Bobra.0350s0008.1